MVKLAKICGLALRSIQILNLYWPRASPLRCTRRRTICERRRKWRPPLTVTHHPRCRPTKTSDSPRQLWEKPELPRGSSQLRVANLPLPQSWRRGGRLLALPVEKRQQGAWGARLSKHCVNPPCGRAKAETASPNRRTPAPTATASLAATLVSFARLLTTMSSPTKKDAPRRSPHRAYTSKNCPPSLALKKKVPMEGAAQSSTGSHHRRKSVKITT